MTVRLGVTVSFVVLALGACSSGSVRSICAVDEDCGAGGMCSAGECVPTPVSPPTPSSTGDVWSCAEPCGSVCCDDGAECRNGACVPACGSGIWCGPLGEEVCCGEGQHCEQKQCVGDPPPGPQCPDGLSWDEGLADCVAPVEVRACDRPQTGFFDSETLWEASPSDGYDQVITTPLVIDLDGDGASDVVAPFFSEQAGFDHPAVLRALSGIDGHELWKTPAAIDGLAGTSQLAAARFGVGVPVTIVGVDEDGRLSAFRGDTGARIWRSRSKDGAPVTCNVGWGAPAIADLDGDAKPELVCGFTVFDANGVMRWSADEASGPLGSIVALADLNSDGRLDITDGSRAYTHDGKLLWWAPGKSGGLAAVADLVTQTGAPGRDGLPEIVVARQGELELRDGATGTLLTAPFLLPTWDGFACWSHPSAPGVGGAPAVGDVDGDGVPEVVVASGECLAAMAITRGAVFTEWKMLWGQHAVDESSSVTGVAMFDFDGDGWLDVVHADETVLHVVEGSHGAPKYEAPHCSGTVYEEPVVADVDGDGSANIVVARNGVGRNGLGCNASVKPGIVVLRERQSRWANARAIWNQHGYVVPEVCDGADNVCAELGPEWGAHGRPAMDPLPAWGYSDLQSPFPYNAARANTHGPYTPWMTADAEVSHVLVDAASCPGALVARVRVVNHGQTPLRPGTRVRVESASPKGHGSAIAVTTHPIPPGGAETVNVPLAWAQGSATVRAQVDADDRTAECDETNNAFGPVTVACP